MLVSNLTDMIVSLHEKQDTLTSLIEARKNEQDSLVENYPPKFSATLSNFGDVQTDNPKPNVFT